jgi:hypothetical protein
MGKTLSYILSLLFLMIFQVPSSVAQAPTTINCRKQPLKCEIEIGGQKVSLGAIKDNVLTLVSKSSHLSENAAWSLEHKPDSLWYVTKSNNVIIAGLKFKADKLDGAMVMWSPESTEQVDFAVSVLNLLGRFSNEGSTQCILTTETTPHPQQEDREATFQCGLRSIRITDTHFQQTLNGQNVPDAVEIVETLGNW